MKKEKSTKSYINSAGGFSDNAQKKSVYVVYANGDVKGTNRFLFLLEAILKLLQEHW